MMSSNNVTKLNFNKIYLFDDSFNQNKFSNSLKEFIYFIRFTGVKGIIDFSYSSHKDSIHHNLSLKENFILDSVPTSLIKDKDDNLRNRIEQLNNKKLVELISGLESIDRKATELTEEECKIASIVKSLLSHTDYIFLELPDQSLSFDNLNRIKECILYEVENNNRTIFLKAKNNDMWIDIATDIVTKNERQEYIHTPNALNTFNHTDKTEQKPDFSFNLIKNAG